jgi:hypothetical protein
MPTALPKQRARVEATQIKWSKRPLDCAPARVEAAAAGTRARLSPVWAVDIDRQATRRDLLLPGMWQSGKTATAAGSGASLGVRA